MDVIATPTVSAGPPGAVSAQTRLLLPFLFERRAAARAADALAGGSAGIARGVWSRESHRKLYRYRLEMTGQLDRFLFSHGESGKVEGAYLRASPERVGRWLGDLEVALADGRTARLGVPQASGVELFLTAHGAGVLCLTVDLGQGVDLERVLELNRRLSILTRPGDRAPWLWARVPEGEGAAAPVEHDGPSVPLGERLGRPGARFSIAELVAALLEPMRGLGVAPIQESLCVHAVVALPDDVDLASDAAKAWAAPLLAALAEVQGTYRPGKAFELPDPPHLVDGRHHWSAATLQGAAHLVVPGAGGAGEAPASEVHDRWFVPYLTALLQRCAIKKAAEEATEMVVAEDVRHEAVSRLRSDVLSFALAGALPEVSVRYALHRYYRMCQRAVDLDRNLEQVRSALGDLEAQISARRQVEIAEAQRDIARQSQESQESSHEIHMSLVWIEVFIVVAYASELVKFFVIELPHIHDPALRWGAGILAVATGVGALAVLRPWDHRRRRGTRGRGGAAKGAPVLSVPPTGNG
jgi:hypothetical protein